MFCKYTYKGVEYTRGQLLDQIMNGELSVQMLDEQKNRKILSDYFGESYGETQMSVVMGLIDGKALGQAQEDGSILLSAIAPESVVHHEAFHRAWQLLSQEERNAAIKEFKTKKNWKDLIAVYEDRYGTDEDVLIEEYFADEFADFILGEPTPKTFLQKLFDKLKKILQAIGLVKQPEIDRIYNLLKNGGFKSISVKGKTFRKANAIKLDGIDITVERYTPILDSFHRKVVSAILKSNNLDDLLANSSDIQTAVNKRAIAKEVLAELKNVTINEKTVAQHIIDVSSLSDLEYEDWFNKQSVELQKAITLFDIVQDDFMKDNPVLLRKYDSEYLTQFRLKRLINEDSANEETGDKKTSPGKETGLEDDKTGNGEGAFYDKNSFEVDPNSSMSGAIKLLLSSLEDPTERSSIGLPKTYNWVKFSNFLYENLSGLEPNANVFLKRMQQLSKHKKYGSGIQKILELFDNFESNNRDIQKSAVKFITHFAKTQSSFLVSEIGKDKTAVFNATEKAKIDFVKKTFDSYFKAVIAKKTAPMFEKELKEILAETGLNKLDKLVTLFNLNGIVDSLEDQDSSAFKIELEKVAKEIEKSIGGKSQKPYIDIFSTQEDVKGYTDKMYEMVLNSGMVVELSVINSVGEKVYGISQNMYMTQLVNKINYHLKELRDSKKDYSPEEVEQYLVKAIPQLKNAAGYSFFLRNLANTYKKSDVQFLINNGVQTESTKIDKELSELEETTLLSVYISQMLDPMSYPIFQTAKHSDRSVLYAVRFNNSVSQGPKLPVSDISADRLNEFESNPQMKRVFANYLRYEMNKIKMVKEGVFATVQNMNSLRLIDGRLTNESIKGMLFNKMTGMDGKEKEILSLQDYENLSKTEEGSNEWNGMLSKILKAVNEQAKIDHEYLKEKGIYEPIKSGKSKDVPVGIPNEIWKKYGGGLGWTQAITKISYLYSVNSLIGYLDQSILFSGDPALYKNAADTFKRLNTLSSTGDLSVVGSLTDSLIRSYETETQIKGSNGKYFNYYDTAHASDTQMIASVTYAEENHFLPDDVLNGYQKRSFDSMKEMLINIGFTEQDAIKHAEIHSKRIRDSYAETNEPDGQSWLNLFEWRRVKTRWGQWSDAHERLFRMELKILNGESVFEIPTGKDAAVYLNEFLGLAETIKGQYYGPYWNSLSKNDKFVVQGVAKTSFYPMLPSQIRGTKLETLNRAHIEKGVGVIHVNSARKIGQRILVNKKLEPLNDQNHINGLPRAYNAQGDVNLDPVKNDATLNNLVQYMDAEYFKHQVFIPNKEKEKVTSSTQSFKLTLSNLFNNGVPIDMKTTNEEWEAMAEEDKQKSKIYQYVKEYSELAEKRIMDTIDGLEAKINFNSNTGTYNSYKQIVDILKESLNQRGATKNVFDVLDIFERAETKALEFLPNRFRIEPVLYSLIRNDVTTQKRNGNSVPQVTSLWWDPVSKKRAVSKNKVQASSELGMYEGNKNYAEVMMPLPTKWVESLMGVYKTRDLIKLVDMINADIQKGNFDKIDEQMLFIKGLRIPNQQLSSNDVFKIKKFLVPTNTAMVVVPPLIAVKVGSDFDIDKLTMYLAHGEVLDGKFRYINEDFIEKKKSAVQEEIRYENEVVNKALDLYNNAVAQENRIVFDEGKGKKKISTRRKQSILVSSISNLLNDEKIEKKTKETLSSVLDTLKTLAFNNSMKYDEKLEENKLLKSELDIMQLPINFMNLMKPTDDMAWKNDARNSLIAESKKADNQNDPDKKKFYRSLDTQKLTLFDVYTAKTNVQKTIENIMSKGGVGQVAVSITNHAVNQLYGFKIRLRYEIPRGEGKDPIVVDRTINFFDEDKGDFANIVNENAEFISDLLSGLLTSQVDAVKDPYAKSLGLVGNTLNVATYLLQRGVPHKDIVYFFAQPAIKEYIEKTSINEGLLYKEHGLANDKRKELENWFDEKKILYGAMSPAYLEIKKKYIENNVDQLPIEVTGNKFSELLKEFNDNYQMELLDMFLNLSFDSSEHRVFMSAIGLDTFKGKGISEVYERMKKINAAEGERGLVDNIGKIQETGLMLPFRRAFEKYEQFFFPLYFIENTKLSNKLFNKIISGKDNAEKRQKLYKAIPEDFGTFLIQNLSDFFDGYSFSSIMTGENSVPKELYRMIQSNEYNLGVFNYLLPQFRVTSIGNTGVDAIRKSDLSDNIFQLNEYNEELEELRIRNPEFFKRLLAYTFYAYGVSNSIFSLESVMPSKNTNALGKETVGKESILSDALNKFNQLSDDSKMELVEQFVRIFFLANPWMHKFGGSVSSRYDDAQGGEFSDLLSSGMLDMFEMLDYGIDEETEVFDGANLQDFGMIKEEGRTEPTVEYLKKYDKDNKTYVVVEKDGNKTSEYYALSGRGYKAFNVNDSVMMFGQRLEEKKRDLSAYIKRVEPSLSETALQTQPVSTQSTETFAAAQTTTKGLGFKGYKGGFENTGKGTLEGDGKDKAMRKDANGFIGELGKYTSSSTLTSASTIFKTEEKDVTLAASISNGAIAPANLNDNATIIMLARNNEGRKGQPLFESVKEAILKAHNKGAEFIVGDMPQVDSQFIDYLQEIGANFTVYHTGNKPRIEVSQPATTPTTAQVVVTEQQVDQIFRNNPNLAQVIFKEFNIDYKDMSYNGKIDWVEESVLGDAIMLREALSEAEEGQYPSKKELQQKEEEYRKHYTAIDIAAKQTYIEYVQKEGLNEDIEKLEKFLPTSLVLSAFKGREESEKKCKTQ